MEACEICVAAARAVWPGGLYGPAEGQWSRPAESADTGPTNRPDGERAPTDDPWTASTGRRRATPTLHTEEGAHRCDEELAEILELTVNCRSESGDDAPCCECADGAVQRP